ncbi:MAG: hypothetical protein HKN82_04530 [Akkermansiaceae bacterium]|nr:hypothetical protein [Akkermansiaceae bacterium]
MNGQAVSNSPSLPKPFDPPPSASSPSPRGLASSRSDRLDDDRRRSTKGAPVVRAPEEDLPSRREVITRMARAGAGDQRDIECPECGHVQRIPLSAASVLCPRCGDYGSLKNYEILTAWDRRIRTRGNVFVHRKGRVADVLVQCRNLTVEGEFHGSAQCTGDLMIRRDATIGGRIECERLLVCNKARVEFTGHVQAREVFIDGAVRGDMTCLNVLRLDRMATLDGDLKVASIEIAEGARHTGHVTVHPVS